MTRAERIAAIKALGAKITPGFGQEKTLIYYAPQDIDCLLDEIEYLQNDADLGWRGARAWKACAKRWRNKVTFEKYRGDEWKAMSQTATERIRELEAEADREIMHHTADRGALQKRIDELEAELAKEKP